ncbi:hypothetical protein M9H77_03961 [Catharanthus roseus]|uniref:Uncharacterized protein n=1 Tax=Catharanthus roseus TaxID=4058 RepID=A0ACC0CCN6_CATRO|nr:hypothetical protein M9H77_03961 [Catharanthus roseus]
MKEGGTRGFNKGAMSRPKKRKTKRQKQLRMTKRTISEPLIKNEVKWEHTEQEQMRRDPQIPTDRGTRLSHQSNLALPTTKMAKYSKTRRDSNDGEAGAIL